MVISLSGEKKDKRNGHLVNEDIFYTDENITILMDGATGLGDNELDVYKTSAEWYVAELLQYLKSKLLNQENIELEETVKSAIEYMKERIEAKEEELGIRLKPYEVPSSSLVISRKRGEFLELFSLGDSIILIKYKSNDTVEEIRDCNLHKLDNNVWKLMKDISIVEDITIKEARNKPEVIELLRENRQLKNKVGGYYIASNDSSVVSYAYQRKYKLDELEKVFVCTDGFDIDVLGMTKEKFMHNISDNNIEYYAKEIKRKLLEDKNWEKYQNRFKDCDDITAIKVL